MRQKPSSQANTLASHFPKLIPESLAASFEDGEEDCLEMHKRQFFRVTSTKIVLIEVI